MEHQQQLHDVSPIFDNLDIDILVKVFSHTAFSPFFLFFIPVFYFFQGAKFTDRIVVLSALYFVAVSCFWFLRWYSRLYRNQANLLFGTGPLDWGEQIIVVTGGASGVGELLANTLAVRNVNVVVLDVDPILTENYNIAYYKCDVSKWEEVEAVSKRIVEEIGHPTALINNAGVVQGKLILDLKPEDIKQTFEVNTLAHFWTLKAFLPEMLKQKKGHIITMSSVIGLGGCAQLTDYGASKAALTSLHESLRYELDKRYHCPKIRTTLLLPGHISTPMFSRVNFPSHPLYRFFFPSVQPITIVKSIIVALDEQHSRTILMPFFTQFAPFLKILPSFLRDLVQWIAGADYIMKGFVKVTGRRPEEGPVPTESSHSLKSS